MPKLSVLLPVYNGVDDYPVGQMSASIKSILALDTDLELIVVNDCSTDDTGNYLRNPIFDGITIVDSPYNGGQAAALNKAMELATGEYIWQWSIRGTAYAEAVELVNTLDNNPDIGFVSGQMLSYGGDKEYTHRPPHIFDRKRYIERYLANFYMFRRIDGIEYTDYMQTPIGRHIGVVDRDMLMQLLERGAVGASLHDVPCVAYYNGGYHTMSEVAKYRDKIDRLFWQRWEHIKWPTLTI
jgi:glycosyltransferase involved in cell wall biosynthesis